MANDVTYISHEQGLSASAPKVAAQYGSDVAALPPGQPPIPGTTVPVSDKFNPPVAGPDTSGNLSTQVFSDPEQFLQTLKAAYAEIAKTDPNKLSLNDLQLYAKTGEDPDGKAAAKIAANNYIDLQQMDPLARHQFPNPQDGISSAALDADINMMKGDTSSQYWDIVRGGAGNVAVDLVHAALAGLGAAVTVGEVPPVGIGLGLLTADQLIDGANKTFETISTSQNLGLVAQRDQQMVQSWLPKVSVAPPVVTSLSP